MSQNAMNDTVLRNPESVTLNEMRIIEMNASTPKDAIHTPVNSCDFFFLAAAAFLACPSTESA